MSKLSPKILSFLAKKTSIREQSIRNSLSSIKKTMPNLTQNAAAQVFALKRGFSISQKLSRDDKSTLPNMELHRPVKINQSKKKRKSLARLVSFETEDKFLQAHIIEINKAYTARCYTATFILCRKIMENLLIEILRKKYPGSSQSDRLLYYNHNQGKFHDLKIIIKNLKLKARDFGPEKKQIELICKKSTEFKEDANDKTHSLFHIVKNKKEIDDKDPQTVLDLVENLMNKIS